LAQSDLNSLLLEYSNSIRRRTTSRGELSGFLNCALGGNLTENRETSDSHRVAQQHLPAPL